MKKRTVPCIMHFLDVVDDYLHKEPIKNFPREWKQYHRAAVESMNVVKEMLGIARMVDIKKIARNVKVPQVLLGPVCIDFPRWEQFIRPALATKVPKIKRT